MFVPDCKTIVKRSTFERHGLTTLYFTMISTDLETSPKNELILGFPQKLLKHIYVSSAEN